MITTSVIRDAFEYFAKFPDHAGVMESFNITTSSHFEEEYAAFKTTIENLDEHSIIPGIKDYIFGVDEDLVKKRIQDVSGFYLFVDYGSLTSERDQYKVKRESMLLAITVAIPRDLGSLDHVEAVLYADQALDYIRQIRNRMISDQRDSPFLQQLTFPNEITPFFARELQSSTGWTQLFSREGIGLLE